MTPSAPNLDGLLGKRVSRDRVEGTVVGGFVEGHQAVLLVQIGSSLYHWSASAVRVERVKKR